MWGNNINELLGKTLVSIENINGIELVFCTENETYQMYHQQDCCESVYIEDIIGDIDDLLNQPITMAEEVSERGDDGYGTHTWTFYKLATVKGYVTIRWYGSSNGYYSESVSFRKVEK